MKKKQEMPKNQRGQVSIEFILVVGAVLVMVIAVFPYVQKQSELNKALTAARDGAEYGASMRAMGFTDTKRNPEGIVKIEEFVLVDKTEDLTAEEKERVSAWYQIRFKVVMPDYMRDNPSCTQSSVGGTIRNQAIRYINYAFSGTWPSGMVSQVFTNKFKFTAACDFV